MFRPPYSEICDTFPRLSVSGMVGLAPKWVRLAPNGTNLGLYQSDFSTFGSIEIPPPLGQDWHQIKWDLTKSVRVGSPNRKLIF